MRTFTQHDHAEMDRLIAERIIERPVCTHPKTKTVTEGSTLGDVGVEYCTTCGASGSELDYPEDADEYTEDLNHTFFALEKWKSKKSGRLIVWYSEETECVQLQCYNEFDCDGNILSSEADYKDLRIAAVIALLNASGYECEYKEEYNCSIEDWDATNMTDIGKVFTDCKIDPSAVGEYLNGPKETD